MKKLVHPIFHFLLLIVILLSNSNAPSVNADGLPPYNWTDSSLREVFMLDTDDVWAVGSGGTIIRWNGAIWQTIQSPTGSWLQSIFMFNTTAGWAIGSGGSIIHWNGTEWSDASSPTASNLYGVSMVNSSDGWAVGWAGLIIRWNGTGWSTFTSPTSRLLFSVRVVNSNDGWAVGSSGTIIRWNGTEWNNATSPTASTLLDVFMVNATEGWAVGAGGIILHWNGTDWNNFTSSTTRDLRSVFMVNATNGWAVGDLGTVIGWNGTAWSNVPSPATQNLFSVHMMASNDGWAVGDFGEIINWDGTEWTRSTTPIHQGDLIITGDDVFVIEDIRFDINGSIIVEENATLILRNAIINFTGSSQGIVLQNPANGNPKLQAENTTIMNDLFYNRFYGNSSATLSNCTMSGFYIHDTANAAITNSTINFIQARDSPTVSLANSTLGDIDIVSMQANVSITNLSPGFIASWDFWLNCSLTLSPFGEAPHVTMMDTMVTRWHFSFQPTSASEIINSQIWYLHANGPSHVSICNSTLRTIELYHSSVAELTNSIYTESVRLFNDAKVYINWYLNIHVIDSIGQNVPSANVTATYSNTTTAESKLTDANGLGRLTLMEKMMNATGSYPIGNYTITATYETHLSQESVNMTENKEITIQLPFIIPEFPTNLILPLFIAATLVAAIFYRRKQKPKLRTI